MFASRIEFIATVTAESPRALTCNIQQADASGNPIVVSVSVPKAQIDIDSAVKASGDSGLLIVEAGWAASAGLV